MTRIVMMLILLTFLVAGCSENKISEREFQLIWKDYLKTEFVEGFDEKQSTFQREQILRKIVSKYEFSLEELKSYMKKNHREKYRKLFGN
jgi:hypothetical protein